MLYNNAYIHKSTWLLILYIGYEHKKNKVHGSNNEMIKVHILYGIYIFFILAIYIHSFLYITFATYKKKTEHKQQRNTRCKIEFSFGILYYYYMCK